MSYGSSGPRSWNNMDDTLSPLWISAMALVGGSCLSSLAGRSDSPSDLPLVRDQSPASCRTGHSRNDASSGQPALADASDGLHLADVGQNRIQNVNRLGHTKWQ